MIKSVLLSAMIATSVGPSSHESRSLELAILNVLRCAEIKDLACLSRHALHAEQLYVETSDGQRVFHPHLAEDAFSEQASISLYKVASNRSAYAHSLFRVSRHHYEVVFYRANTLPANSEYQHLVSQPNFLQCGFVRVRTGWRLTNSICGYVDE